jgi:hypothetical protein
MAIVFLDTGIIGLVTTPRKQGQSLACEKWMFGLLGILYIYSPSRGYSD